MRAERVWMWSASSGGVEEGGWARQLHQLGPPWTGWPLGNRLVALGQRIWRGGPYVHFGVGPIFGMAPFDKNFGPHSTKPHL